MSGDSVVETATFCQNCDQESAVSFCENCSEIQYYCEECATNHSQNRRYASHVMKPLHRDVAPKLTLAQSFDRFLKSLGQDERSKLITTNDALKISRVDYSCDANKYTFEPKELLTMILRLAMSCNYKCREVRLCKEGNRPPYLSVYHPMDTLLALIIRCDPIFRQYLYSQLYTCQLAVPMLLPFPDSGKTSLMLWAMKGLVKEWKPSEPTRSGLSQHGIVGRLVDCELPIISFMRLNKAKSLFKSKILNEVMSDSVKHKYFFDYECEGNDADRMYADGLVEVSWYIPSGSSSDLFSTRRPIVFTNLRGDARGHLKQFNVLNRISHTCFLFLSTEDVDEVIALLSSTERIGKLILVMHSCSKEFEQKIPNCTLVTLKGLCHTSVVETFRAEIEESIKQKSELKCSPLSECVHIAKSFEIEIDAALPECQEGKEIADSIMECINQFHGGEKKTAREEFLPLQGREYWQEWAKLNKKQKRMNPADIADSQTEVGFTSEQEELKSAIIKKQLRKTPSNPMKNFLQTIILSLKPNSSMVRDYFLCWLQIKLDDYSREVLPGFQEKCEYTHAELAKLDDEQTSSEEQKKSLQKQLFYQSLELSNASFGLEHFFRELAQTYEAVCTDKSHQDWPQVKKLPKVIAELMLSSGLCLELIDGDAAHIAINWVTAVLNELKLLVGAKSKLFVMSALGVQSSHCKKWL